METAHAQTHTHTYTRTHTGYRSGTFHKNIPLGASETRPELFPLDDVLGGVSGWDPHQVLWTENHSG